MLFEIDCCNIVVTFCCVPVDNTNIHPKLLSLQINLLMWKLIIEQKHLDLKYHCFLNHSTHRLLSVFGQKGRPLTRCKRLMNTWRQVLSCKSSPALTLLASDPEGEFDYLRKSLTKPERLKCLKQAQQYLNIYLPSLTSSLFFFSTSIAMTPCSILTTIHEFQLNLFSLHPALLAPGLPPPPPPPLSYELCQCHGTAVQQTDRQADGSDTSDISGIQHNNVDGNRWRQWQRGRERLEEKTGDESEWKGKQRDMESAAAR